MNIALIFAGGTGQRMNSKTVPKQFLELHGKPILIYTIEQFEFHPQIDGVVVVCLKEWIERLRELINKFGLKKIKAVLPGGQTGQESIFNGVKWIFEHYPPETGVLVHDGVRPLIDSETISADIECLCKNGNAVTVTPAQETIAIDNDEEIVGRILNRDRCKIARAPQCFPIKVLYEAHIKAKTENLNGFIDSASLMQHNGMKLYMVEGPVYNIKITTPSDFYVFRAIMDAMENSQIFGL